MMSFKYVERSKCIGCGLCYSVCPFDAIEMKTDEWGFLPELDESACTDCGKCTEVCPGINILDYPDRYGKIKKCIICSSKDSRIRHIASSGGGCRTILRAALENGLVDRVIITRATNDPYIPETIITGKVSDLTSDRLNSVYSPTSPLSAMKNLESGLKYAFVGLPCHIAGLELCPEIKKSIPLTIGLFCHQTPSYKFVDQFINDVSEGGDIEWLRYRGDGWPGQTVAYHKNGRKTESNFPDMWVKYNYNRQHQMERCGICSYYTAEYADLSIGDPWSYLGKDQEGVSLVLVRSEMGERALKAAAPSLNIEDVSDFAEAMKVHDSNDAPKYENKMKQH